MARTRVVYACDIGSTRGSQPNFAWVRLELMRSYNRISAYSSMPGLIDALGQDMRRGYDIALGFEVPRFIPIPRDASELSKETYR